MKILHTSDWHLGKYLERASRLEEQKLFIQELVKICDEQYIDLIIIAGDIFDTYSPPVNAEQLFFEALNSLSDGGKRVIVIISGNHDSPNKIAASKPIAEQQGIILVPLPKSIMHKVKYEHYEIVDAHEGCFEIEIKGERAIIATMPYPSEKRLNEVISEHWTESEIQKDYSQKIAMLFSESTKYYREDTINIAVGHFYIIGGEVSNSERDISLGGAYAVEAKHLPQNAQYIAMGHLHRPQKVNGIESAYYSGSPLHYSKSEIGYAKSVYIVDVAAGKKAEVTKYFLKNIKGIEIWKYNSVEEVLKQCEIRKNDNIYIYLELTLDRVLDRSDIRAINSVENDIVDIQLNICGQEELNKDIEDQPKTFIDEFKDFYMNRRNAKPSEEMINMLMDILQTNEDEV